MLIPIEVLETELKEYGVDQKIVRNEYTIIGGRDDKLDDAPLEYYRVHFWNNSDTAKQHENYVFMGKHSGFICISLMQEKNGQFRVLIRSALAWKSVIINSLELNQNSKSSTNTLVLKEAMNRFKESIFPEESELVYSELSSPLNMMSIDVSSNVDLSKDTDKGVSRNSSLNSIRSSLTLSELRSSMAGSQDTLSFSRFGSMASLSEIPNDSFDEMSIDEDKKMSIIEDLIIKFFKSAYKIKDKSFPSNLLELEKALRPKSFNFDVINVSGENAEFYKKFEELLGQEINRKESINYVKILTEKFKLADAISPSTSKKLENLHKNADNIKSPNSAKLDFIIDEFIETETNYLQQLTFIDKIFISYLQNDDCGKFILKIKDFKDIFGDLVEFIPIHQKLLSNLKQSEGLENFVSALSELSESRSLYSYQTYFTNYEKRIASLKSCLEIYPKFSQFHESCVNNVAELNKKGLDQLLIAPIQRIPRYVLLLREALKYVADVSSSEKLRTISAEIEKVVQFLNMTKHKSEQTEMLFTIQRKVNYFPPDFLRAERNFLTKIACFMVDPVEGKISKIRLTIYLCNDMLIFAKKRSSIAGHITHDFVLATKIKDIQINSTRSKKGEKMLFTADIDMGNSFVTHNTSDFDATLFSPKRQSNIPRSEENVTLNSCFQFSPKNQKKLSAFINEFTEARNQFLLSESPAKMLYKKDDYKDVFFHVYESHDQIILESRSPILILYLEDENDLKEYSQALQNYMAVAIVQGRSNTFRFTIATKNTQFSDLHGSFYETSLDLKGANSFIKDFYKSILNAHLLISNYPPYSKNINHQRRFVLESAVAAAKCGSLSSINKSSAIKGFLSALSGSSEKSNGDRLSRGSSLKNGFSPLSSPSKSSNTTRIDEMKREIQMESSMSLLHL